MLVKFSWSFCRLLIFSNLTLLKNSIRNHLKLAGHFKRFADALARKRVIKKEKTEQYYQSPVTECRIKSVTPSFLEQIINHLWPSVGYPPPPCFYNIDIYPLIVHVVKFMGGGGGGGGDYVHLIRVFLYKDPDLMQRNVGGHSQVA